MQAEANRKSTAKALIDLSNALSVSIDQPDALQTTVDGIARFMDMDSAAVYLLEKTTLRLHATSPPLDPATPEEFLRADIKDHPHIRRAITGKKTIVVRDAKHAKLSVAEAAIRDARGLRTLIYAPLITAGKVIGVLIAGTVGSPRLIALEEIDALGALAAIAALIIERTEAEEKLKQQSRMIRAMIDSAPFGAHVYRLEPDNRLVYVAGNESADRILGIECDKFTGMTLEDAFPGNVGTEIPDMYRRAAKTGEPYSTQQIVYDADGITGVFEVHAVQTAPNQMVAFFRDVTETRKAQIELEKSELKYRSIFQHATEGIVQTTIDGDIIAINPWFVKMLGYESEQEFKERIRNFTSLYVEVKDRARLIDKLVREATVNNYEVQMKKRDGKPVWVSINSTMVAGEDGQPPYLESMIVDTSSRRQAADALKASHKNLEETLHGLVATLALTVETRDPYTAEHQRRVTELAVAIARAAGLSAGDIAGLEMAAAIHDIGKIYVPAETLNKPGKVTPVEFELIKTHAAAGYDIVKDVKFKYPIAAIIRQHHERIDGSGYPDGLKGEDISVGARIMAIADVVEAMSSHRPYRPALGIDAALAEITQRSGTAYDPKMAAICVKLFKTKKFAFK